MSAGRYTGPLVAAVGLGVLTPAAPVADASPSVDWDRVAACESSGNWSATDASGHHGGGLQFTDSTWRAYGGSGQPEDASRGQQIAVAERVLAGQGIGAWPVCGPRGLGGNTRHTTPETSPRASPRTSQASPRTSPPTRESPVRPQVQPQTQSHPRTDPSTHYRVRRNDTLFGIANARHVPGGYPAIANMNAISDVNMIHPDDVLTLPTSPPARPQPRARPPIQGPSPTLTTPTPRGAHHPTTSTRTPAAARTAQPPRDASDPRVHVPSRPTSHSHAAAASSSRVVAEARLWIGTPYRWGGTSRRGVDCSGLVQQVYRTTGVILPRTAREQMAAAQRIIRADARPGDLVGNPSGSHIGIYIGGNQMIDSPSAGGRVGVHTLYRDSTVFGRLQ
jgi:cell wall-associated NlpC family hydrolase